MNPSELSPTPLEIANFLCNLPRDLREWLVQDKIHPGILVHVMSAYSDKTQRVTQLIKIKNMDAAEFERYYNIISMPNDKFMEMLGYLKK